MSAKTGVLIFGVLFLLVVGSAQAQSGIGRYERMQIMADDLKNSTRYMYLTAERQFPRSRTDAYVLSRLYRLRQEAANYEHQVERNFDDPDAIRRAYQRLYDVWYDTDYAMRRMHGFGFLNREFEDISIIVHRLSPGPGYGDRYYDERYGYDDFDDHQSDRDDSDDDDDDYDDDRR